MESPKEIINSFFDNENSYDEWQEMRSDTRTQIRKSEVNQERFKSSGNSTETLLFWDLRLLRHTSQDYDEAMERIIDGGGTMDEEIIQDNRKVLATILYIVELENGVLDAAFAMGAMKIGVLYVPIAILQKRAIALEAALQELKKRLEKAKDERMAAWGKAIFSFATDSVMALLPEVGLLAKGAVFLGKLVVDELVSSPEQSSAVSAGDKANESMGAFSDALSETANVSTRTKSVAKGAGKAATVVGFAFDANEVLDGYKNVDRIQDAISKAEHANKTLQREIASLRPGFERFIRDYKRWITSIQAEKREIADARAELLDFRNHSRYKVPS